MSFNLTLQSFARACVYMYVYICMYVCMYIYVYMCVCVCVRARARVCTARYKLKKFCSTQNAFVPSVRITEQTAIISLCNTNRLIFVT